MRRKKPASKSKKIRRSVSIRRRGVKTEKIPVARFSQSQIKAKFERQRAAEAAAKNEKKIRSAVGKFRPRKGDRGKIVFVGIHGKRDAAAKGRKGYAVYVTGSGKKWIVPEYDKKARKLEKLPKARKLFEIDISRFNGRKNRTKARKEFIASTANPVAAGAIKKRQKGGAISEGDFSANAFYDGGKAVDRLAKEFLRTIKNQIGQLDFATRLGFHILADGRKHFIETDARFIRRIGQVTSIAELRSFFGRVVYAGLAHALGELGFVLSGSAQYVSKLRENKGKPRNKWTKGGREWDGRGKRTAKLENIEWRFDRLNIK